MPDFLRFINELSVNGKPVEEDELEDDYTAEDSDEVKDNEETDETGLDLTPPTEETQEGDNNDDDDSDDGGASDLGTFGREGLRGDDSRFRHGVGRGDD